MTEFHDILAENARLRSIVAAPGGSKATLYVVSVLVLCVLTVAFVLGITIIRPEADNSPLITTVIAVVVPIATALLAGTVQQVHLAVNSRLSQLLELTAKASLAEGQAGVTAARSEGTAAGIEQERERGA